MIHAPSHYVADGVMFDPATNVMKIDLSQERKIRIIGVDEKGNGREKEYCLKVTERKGLVLV